MYCKHVRLNLKNNEYSQIATGSEPKINKILISKIHGDNININTHTCVHEKSSLSYM